MRSRVVVGQVVRVRSNRKLRIFDVRIRGGQLGIVCLVSVDSARVRFLIGESAQPSCTALFQDGTYFKGWLAHEDYEIVPDDEAALFLLAHS